MAAFCGKHDITFSEGGTCWCCEQEKAKAQVETKEPEKVSAPDDKKDK